MGLDALWQLAGFFLGWIGASGRGRALGVGGVKFNGQVEPDARRITYQVDVKRLIKRKFTLGIVDGTMSVDGAPVYKASDIRVGVFTSAEQM